MSPTSSHEKRLSPERTPHKVQDPLFHGHPFFNPADPTQVKYEMLRRVDVDGMPVAATVEVFGFSRVSFYAIKKRFQEGGMGGLLGKPRGPKGGHKLKGQALEALRELSRDMADPADLAAALLERTGVMVHPRTVRRALAASKKKPAAPMERTEGE